ncbi:MAG: CpsD/CapB family tyrosine-protein kinase, partial [Clostridia bacterium]|nr:CpsD/CapB family tyrosine-protein kinase [Clostridia bacterium]
SRRVLFTSYEPNAGKSVSIANIAVSMAQTGARVILIDADMRNASLHRIFKITNSNGLSKFLGGFCELDGDVINKSVTPNLDVISAGPIPPNPSELLGSERMGSLLDTLSSQYDYVFVDTPPIGVVSDALSLFTHLKKTVIVAREGQSRYDHINSLAEQISSLGGKICGIILTDVSSKDKVIDKVYSKKSLSRYVNSTVDYSGEK